MRLVRLGRNGPGVSEMGLGCMGMWAAMGTLATRTPSRPSMPRSRPASPCRIPATFTARDKRLTATGALTSGCNENPLWVLRNHADAIAATWRSFLLANVRDGLVNLVS